MNGAARPARAVAYLVNVYPSPSHTFVRREIAALEGLGFAVHRFSHRRCAATLVEPADRTEALQTEVLLEAGARGAVVAVLAAMRRRPLRTALTAWSALAMALRSDRRFAAHAGYFVLACLLARRLRAIGCRHVHAHFGTNPAAVAWLVHRLDRVGYSVTCHGPHEFVLPDRLDLGTKLAGASLVAAVSAAGEAALRARYPELASRIVRVRCGLDRRWFAAAAGPVPDVPQLVSIGRLEPQKNPLLLLQSAQLLAGRGVPFRLVLVGDGGLRDAAVRFVARHRLGDHVRLVGWGTQAQVAMALADSRALVLGSDDEGLPVAIMEAFAVGRPAIATAVGGVAELVENGVTGWLVPPRDAEALAAAMAACLCSPAATLQAMADAGRRRVQQFDVAQSAQLLAAAFTAAVPTE